MFPNLRAEIARQGLRLNDIVAELDKMGFNITVPMLSQKLSGKYEIYLKEAKALKKIVKANLSIDELFEEAG